MAEQVVELGPGEIRLISFEAIPNVAKTYQVYVDGLSGSFIANFLPTPSQLLREYQVALNEAWIAVDSGNPWDYVMIPGYGLQYADPARAQLRDLMVKEAIKIGMIDSSAEVYFVKSIMYFTNGETVVPYWWPCPYCSERLRSPQALEGHKTTVHWEITNTRASIIGVRVEGTNVVVQWMNNSPFAVQGHVEVFFYPPATSPYYLSASAGQDSTVHPGGTKNVYFPIDAWGGRFYVTLKLIDGALHGMTLDTKEIPYYEWE